MSSFRLFNRQKLGYLITAAAILLGAFVPALANAADVTARSITLSSSSKDAAGASYKVEFKASGAAGAFVVDVCNETPIYKATCTGPTGFIASAATSTTTDFTDVNELDSSATNQVEVTAAAGITAGQNVSVELAGIHNPSTTGIYYARIVTFDTKTHALAYTSTGSNAGVVDNGGVAIPITDTIGVSGAVLESMTFCVSGTDITGPACSVGVSAPTLALGTDPGTGVKSLATGVMNSGDIWTQITTNATGGAVINLKSSATGCGGLVNSSKPSDCYISPAATTGDIDPLTQAKFGVMLNTPSGTGTLQAASATYDTSHYRLNYVDNTAGVTSTYGDPFLNTAGSPATNMTMKLTFGASALASTPAGTYSADLGLIATGKF
jgi:hypothetical protein